MKKLIAYNGNPETKAFYLARVKAHRLADEIVKGKYWENGKGCAVGCTLHSSKHADYETELGIPRILAQLQDGIFEGLPNEEAKLFPELFLESIEVGADLSLVWPRFAHWLLIDHNHGLIRFAKSDKSKKAIHNIADLYAIWIAGNKMSIEEWNAAAAAASAEAASAYAASASSAASASAYASYAASYAAAASSAAAAAAAASAEAAAAYASYGPYAAAKLKARSIQYKKFLELLKEAK